MLNEVIWLKILSECKIVFTCHSLGLHKGPQVLYSKNDAHLATALYTILVLSVLSHMLFTVLE